MKEARAAPCAPRGQGRPGTKDRRGVPFGRYDTDPAGSAPGVGKTAAVEEARRTAVAESARVLRLAWEAAESPPGVGAVADAVCRMLSRIHDGRLPMRITAIRRVWVRTENGDSGGELALLSVLSEMLAEAARHVPFAVVVDDLGRMPTRTGSALWLMSRVFRLAGVPVVIVGRPLAARRRGRGLASAADRVLHLSPLRSEEADELVGLRLGRPAEPALVAEVQRSLRPLAGNPAAVLSVLSTLEESGGLLYEPTFSDHSHGFRPRRGCHTALREVGHTWTGTSWFIEGDIADCFGSLDHQVLLSILGEKNP